MSFFFLLLVLTPYPCNTSMVLMLFNFLFGHYTVAIGINNSPCVHEVGWVLH